MENFQTFLMSLDLEKRFFICENELFVLSALAYAKIENQNKGSAEVEKNSHSNDSVEVEKNSQNKVNVEVEKNSHSNGSVEVEKNSHSNGSVEVEKNSQNIETDNISQGIEQAKSDTSNVKSHDPYVQIDPYVYFSNVLYRKIKFVVDGLNADGYVARRATEVALKTLMLRLNMGKIGINQLFISKGGARKVFYLFAVKINEKVNEFVMENQDKISYLDNLLTLTRSDEDVIAYDHITPNFCKNCLLCLKNCPVGAIGLDVFDAKKCIRHLQDVGKDITVGELAKINNRLLGCDICMNICPWNNVKMTENKPIAEEKSELKDGGKNSTKLPSMPNNVLEKFKLETLFDMVLNKEKRDELGAIIGKNYMRITRLIIILLAIYDNENADFSIPEDSIREYNDERINALLDKIKSKKQQ